MNIIKNLFFVLLILLQIFSGNVVADEEKKEIVNLDEEELPAIDPFSSSSGMSVQGSDQEQTPGNSNLGILNGLRLVGTVVAKTKKIAILSSPDGIAYKFEENDNINEEIILVEIFKDHLLIQNKEENFFEVYMNNVIKPNDG